MAWKSALQQCTRKTLDWLLRYTGGTYSRNLRVQVQALVAACIASAHHVAGTGASTFPSLSPALAGLGSWQDDPVHELTHAELLACGACQGLVQLEQVLQGDAPRHDLGEGECKLSVAAGS